ncbi:MAG: glycosyltransferase family 4 protein [Planctomycetota bacterium]
MAPQTDPLIPTPHTPARVLIVHNRYRQPGGEDVVADAQAALLTEHGHAVHRFEKNNSDINSYSLLGKAALFFNTANNSSSAREIARVATDFKPHAAFVHNTLPLLSPSIYTPLKKAGVKVIQWLHNFRLVCPAGTLYRNGAPCSLCVNGNLNPAIEHNCWNESKLATMALVRMLKKHRRAGTWRENIDLFVALNQFQKQLLVEHAGLPEEKVIVQPNFSNAPALDTPSPVGDSGEFIFIGRLTPEKGVMTLLRAMTSLRDVPIAIAGDGPLSPTVQRACSIPGHVWLGQLNRDVLRARLASARALIFASDWPEGCPSVILEAMSCGKPVIASSVAGATELLQEGKTGLFFPPGNVDALADCVRQLIASPGLEARMASAALARFKSFHSCEAGYRNLMSNLTRLGIE